MFPLLLNYRALSALRILYGRRGLLPYGEEERLL